MGWFSKEPEKPVSSTGIQRGDRLLVTLDSSNKRWGVVTSTNFDGTGKVAIFLDDLVGFVGGTVTLRPEQIKRRR